MFTGIVEEKGKVRYIQLTGESGILAVKARKVLEGTRIGDSIAVNLSLIHISEPTRPY